MDLEFRVVQKSERLIELWLRVQENMASADVQYFVSSIKEVVGKDVEIEVCLVDEIPEDKSGKLRRIVSEVRQF